MGKSKRSGGFKHLLKSVFVETIDEDEDSELDFGDEDAVVEKHTEVSGASTANPKVELDQDIVDSIKKAMDDANLDGYDYYEFMKAVAEQDLSSEKQKYQVVFSVVKGMGITVDHLLTTADHYKKVLSDHRKDFDVIINNEESDTVTKVKDTAVAVESSITDKLDQIEKLQTEIDDLSVKKETLLLTAQNNEATIVKLRSDGAVAYKLFEEQLSDGKCKINQYLK